MIWKSCQKWTTDFMSALFESPYSMNQQSFEFLLKFIGILSEMTCNMIDGCYINFAVCSYYNDNSYGEFLNKITTCVLCIPQVSVLKYQKQSQKIVKLFSDLIFKQTQLFILSVDLDSFGYIFTNIMLPALRETKSMRPNIMQALDHFCEELFLNCVIEQQIFTNAQAQYRQKLTEFLEDQGHENDFIRIFEVLLSLLVTQLFFED